MRESANDRRARLVKLMLGLGFMQQSEGPDYLLSEMQTRRCALNIAAAVTGRLRCVHIVDAAMARRGGLQCLAASLGHLDGTDLSDAFSDYVQKWYPNEFLSPNERDELVADLADHVSAKKLVTYYCLAMGETAQSAFADFDDLLREIEQRPWPEPGHPLIKLIEAIATDARTQSVAALAKRWSDLLIERIEESTGRPGVEREIAERHRSADAKAMLAIPASPRLIFQLDPVTPSPGRYRFTAWLFFGSVHGEKLDESADRQPVSLLDARKALSQLLDKALIMADQIDKNVSELSLEFILPRDLLCEPVEDWTNREPQYMSIGSQFVVVVRDLVRQRDRQRGISWSRKWEKLFQEPPAAGRAIEQWVTCADSPCDADDMYREFQARDCVSLGLTFCPGDSAHKFELAAALDAGVPIVIWPRQCSHTDTPQSSDQDNTLTDFKTDLNARLSEHTLADLRRIVYEMRLQAGAGARRGVTLLWDDFTLRPELDHYPLDAPGPLGG